MRIKQWSIISGILVSAISIVCVVYAFSDKPNTQKNGFRRKIISLLTAGNSVKFANDYYNIAGINGDNIIFYDTTPGQFIRTNTVLMAKDTVRFTIKDKTQITPFYCEVDNTHFLTYAKAQPAIIDYDQRTDKAQTYLLPKRFSRCVPIGNSNFLLRSFIKGNNGSDFYLSRYNTINKTFTVNDTILDYRLDGGFYTAGELRFDKQTRLITYVMYFTNQIYILDTNMHLVKRLHSIDTFTSSDMKVISEQNRNYTLAKPTKTVNKKSRVYNSVLFILSAVKADNETDKLFSRNSVFDMYSISSGKYLGSFYIPYKKGYPPSDFIVSDDALIAVHRNWGVRYTLPPPITKLLK